MNILLIRLKSLGDVAFTLPAVNVVRDNFPSAKITFLTSQENAPLLPGFREVNEVFPLDRAALRGGNPFRVLPEFFGLLRRLRTGKFSLVVDFQGYGETEFFAWWSGAPERWGNVYHPAPGWTYTRSSRRNPATHPAEWNLTLLRLCGLEIGELRNEYILSSPMLAEARKFFSVNSLVEDQPTLFIQPFTSNPRKNWPLEKFLAVARHFQSRGVQIIFGGGPGERARLQPARNDGFVIAAGTPLPVSAALTKLSTVVLGADTGLLHLAVALGKPVVMLMKSKGPGSSHPFQHADWTLTPPANGLVADITTGAVIGACENHLHR